MIPNTDSSKSSLNSAAVEAANSINHDSAEDTQGTSTSRVVLAGVVGNVVEWYDFALFGYLAPVLSPLFFPNESEIFSLLETYGVFAAGFLMRPLGAFVFGYIGDRLGRRQELFLSVIMMAIPTLLLGLLPDYQHIGVMAPILLVMLRLIQGLSVGGEFSGSVTYVAETAPLHRRGFFASFTNVGAMTGMLLGAALATLATSQLALPSLQVWGWRLPFILGGILGLVALRIRTDLPTSEIFQQSQEQEQESLLSGMQQSWQPLLQGILFACGYGVLFYIPLVYLPTYLDEFIGVSLSRAMQVNTVATGLLLASIPLMGWLSDRYIQRKSLLLIATVSFLLLIYPCFWMLQQGSDLFLWIGQILLVIPVGIVLGVAPAMLVELFPTEIRLTGYSITYNLGLGIIGGTSPLLCTWLIDKTENLYVPVFYLAVMTMIAVLALGWMRDRSRDPLQSLADQKAEVDVVPS